ncbi:hypothetical protein RhiJN_26345 [Ceratobasidium sp. AG-Ba]|nr:hypothetical protein RhiJN_26345 [Ceratobasidium sp. AG-Ba]
MARTAHRPRVIPTPARRMHHSRPAPKPTQEHDPRPNHKQFVSAPAAHGDITAQLPTALEAVISRVAQHSLAAGTLANYSSAVKGYIDFCHTYGIPADQLFPAREPVICAFAASHAGAFTGSTAANHIAALKTTHALNNWPWEGGARLKHILRGVTNLAPRSSTKDPRPPVTIHMLRQLRSHLDLELPKDAAVFAMALVLFWGQSRLGEVAGQSRRNTTSKVLPTIRSIGERFTRLGSRELHLPRTKTAQRDGQNIILTRQEDDIDPIHAIAHLLKINKNPPPSTNIFTYLSGPNGTLRALTREEFIGRCNEVWSAHGLPRFSGHSFRIGGTSALLDMGVPPEVVREMGRWKSDAFYRYWRGLRGIATNYVENIHLRDRRERITQPAHRPCPAS